MELLAHAQIVAWEGASLWIIDATVVAGRRTRRTDPHAHHALQLTFGLGGAFGLGPSEITRREDTIIAADTEHVFEAEGLVGHLFIEPESAAGRAISGRFLTDAGFASVPRNAPGDLPDRIGKIFRSSARNNAALIAAGRDLVAALSAGDQGKAPDERISKVIEWASQQVDRPLTLGEAAIVGELSEGRLRHLFVEQTGLPFKTYLLWLRLTRAVDCFSSGVSLTEAAHEAGFSDSAHLSRTFRRMFGIAPAGLRVA